MGGVSVTKGIYCIFSCKGCQNVGWQCCSGYCGFLSLEPHLFDFYGFAELEKEGISIQKAKTQAMSGMEAFTLAYDSLLKILD